VGCRLAECRIRGDGFATSFIFHIDFLYKAFKITSLSGHRFWIFNSIQYGCIALYQSSWLILHSSIFILAILMFICILHSPWDILELIDNQINDPVNASALISIIHVRYAMRLPIVRPFYILPMQHNAKRLLRTATVWSSVYNKHKRMLLVVDVNIILNPCPMIQFNFTYPDEFVLISYYWYINYTGIDCIVHFSLIILLIYKLYWIWLHCAFLMKWPY